MTGEEVKAFLEGLRKAQAEGTEVTTTASDEVCGTAANAPDTNHAVALYMVRTEPWMPPDGVYLYAAPRMDEPWRQPGIMPEPRWSFGTTSTTSLNPLAEEGEEEARPLKEVRDLLNKVALFLSGCGEYPEELGELFDAELLSQATPQGPDYTLVPERAILMTLMWVLGELDFKAEDDDVLEQGKVG
jgi:hypothetical protein